MIDRAIDSRMASAEPRGKPIADETMHNATVGVRRSGGSLSHAETIGRQDMLDDLSDRMSLVGAK